MTEKTWEDPTISVDVVPYFLDPATRELKVALSHREFEPFKGKLALPGVLMLGNEQAKEAALRAVKTKVSDNANILYIKDIGISDLPGRDSRGPSLTIIMLAVIELPESLENVKATLVSPSKAISLELPFDHHTLVERTNLFVEQNLLSDKGFTRNLVGNEFTTREVYSIFSEVRSNNVALDKTNLSRKIKSLGFASSSMTETSDVTTLSMNSTSKGRPSSRWVLGD